MFGMTQSMARTACAMALGLAIQFAVPAMSADAPAQPGSPIPAAPTPGTPPSATAPLPPPAPTPADASAAAEVAQLRSTLADLEKRVAELEKNKHTVEAPFTVTSDGGDIFTVRAINGSGRLTVLGSGGGASLGTEDAAQLSLVSESGKTFLRAGSAAQAQLEISRPGKTLAVKEDGAGLVLELYAGDATRVALTAKPNAPGISASMPGKGLWIGEADGSFGFFGVNGSNKVLGALSDMGGGKYTLKIAPPEGGTPILLAGYHKTGSPGFSLWSGKNQLARIQGNSGGTAATLELFDKGEDVAILSSEEGGVLSFLDPNGSENVSLGRVDENVNGLRVRDKNQKAIDLVARENAGQLTLYDKEKEIVMLLANDGGILDFMDSNGNENLALGRVEENVDGLRIRDNGKKVIDLVERAEGTGLYINKDEKLRAYVGMQNDGTPTHSIFDETGRLAELTQEGSQGSLVLYDKGKMTLSAGPSELRPIPAFRAWDKGNMMFAAGATPAGTGVAVVYGGGDQLGAGMEGYSSGGGKVYAYANGKELVSINTIDSPGKGMVAVRSPDGNTTVAVMRNGSNGGGNVTAMDPSGDGVASLGYTPGGPGTVCVNHKGTQCLGIGLTGMEGFH